MLFGAGLSRLKLHRSSADRRHRGVSRSPSGAARLKGGGGTGAIRKAAIPYPCKAPSM